jgi:hypothetical protein
MEWLALVIPVIFSLILLVFFKHKTVWWEPLPAFILALVMILSFKGCSEYNLTKDEEFHNGYITQAWYYQDWSEWISQTCTESYPCGTDSDGNTTYCTRVYDCSYEDYNPEYWQVVNNIGESWRVSKSEYLRLVKKFNNQTFKDMNRPYCCGNDGDAYYTIFPGSDSLLEFTVTSHYYKNKVKASNSVFKFKDISKSEADSLDLFEYPPIYDKWKQKHLLGLNNKKLEHKLNVLNAKLGSKKEVKVFLMITNKDKEFGDLQEQYWKGGNKNEFNIILGLDKSGKLNWSKIITWSESTELKILVRNWIESKKGKNINLYELVDYLYDNIEEKFVRKPFSDFEYLKVEMTSNQIKWLFFVTIIISLGLSIWIVINEFEEDRKNKKYKW